MTKMKFESPDLTAQNIDRIAALFPNCITEMLDEERSTPEKKVYKRAVNFELLKQMLSPDVVDGDEAYEFTWVGKKAAIVEANKPIRKTLRPCVAESKDWDTTENLYIEGDNLEVLKLLQESYLGKVKMIYIDPPYNTGNDFIYADDFKMESEEWKVESGEWSEEGDRLFKNTDTNGRFHSDWCSMIYSRLLLARNLLTDDGVIFISIDDNEQENLEKICDEVFGRTNMVGMILWKKKTNGNNMGFLPPVHDYILCYAKSIEMISEMGYPVTNEFISKTFSNPDNDARGPWTTSDLSANHKGPYFAICNPKTGEIHYPPQGRYWVFNEQEVKKRIADGRIIFGKSGTGRPIQKIFLSSRKLSKIRADSWWADNGMNEDATKELSELFGVTKLFTHPKPSKLLYHLCKICTDNNDCILDFFSGSATTAHAVMQLNAEDGGHRKFIMVQLPEKCDEKSEAYKAGYKNICEIGKERIRRAGEKILKEQLANNNSTLNSPNSKLDIGFRVLKLDSTNMKDVYYAPGDYDQDFLHQLESNIKDDRTDLDLLFGCLIDWGLPLSLPYKSEQIDGCTVHTYNDGELIACFDANVPESVVKEIAQRKPLRAVFRDSGFASSPEKINMFEIFKLYMPEDANDISKCVRVI
jgi:adenine-specific DNA-methyltransferase